MGKKDKPRPEQINRVRRATWQNHISDKARGDVSDKQGRKMMREMQALNEAVRRNSTPAEIKEGEKQARRAIDQDNRWRDRHR